MHMALAASSWELNGKQQLMIRQIKIKKNNKKKNKTKPK
jgi:hypothetical protein